jgi:hypothetical protein
MSFEIAITFLNSLMKGSIYVEYKTIFQLWNCNWTVIGIVKAFHLWNGMGIALYG